MKNKRLLIVMSVFVFIVAIVILCSSFFSVKTISISWQSELNEFYNISQDEIVNVLEIDSSNNILLVNRQKCIDKLETQYPYLKVESIDKKLPSGIILNLAERREMYIVKIQDGLYAYLDDTGRVLKVDDGSPIGSTIYPCMLYFDGITIMREDFIEGKDADLALLDVLVTISSTLKTQGCSVEDSYNLLKQITITVGYNIHIEIESNYGLSLMLRKVDKDLEEKLEYGLNLYQQDREQSMVGEIVVFKDAEGALSSIFNSL